MVSQKVSHSFTSGFSGFASGSSEHFASPTSGFCGVPGVLTSTRCKTWWGASLRSWFQCIRLWHRTCKTSRGTSLRSWFKCTRLWHRTCKTRQGTSLRLCFQKKCLLARGFGTERARLAGALRYARGLSAQGFRARVGGALRYARGLSAYGSGTERARLAMALRYAHGFKKVPASTRLWHRTCKTRRGTSLSSWFKCTRLSCKTSRGTSLRSWFKCSRLWDRTCKTRALRFARGLKKSASYLWGF